MQNKKVKNAFFPRNRRGQELSTNAIIMIIIGIIVLVVLVLGFTIGWNKLLPFVFSSNNVENIKTACSFSCSTSNTYDFCSAPRTLKAEDLPLPPGADGKVPKSVIGNCNLFSSGDYAKYGIAPCPAVSCG